MDIREMQAEVNKAIEAAMNGVTRILRNKYKDDWDRRAKDLTLLSRIGEASESLTAFISDYILDPSLETAIKNDEDPEDCVTLTTIHSAKGLEAKNCYLVNVNYTQYPSAKAIAGGEDAIEEDRRCLYVAMTRARDTLVIYRSTKAARVDDLDPDESADHNRLYFLNDLPEQFYTHAGEIPATRFWDNYKGQGISLSDGEDFDFS